MFQSNGLCETKGLRRTSEVVECDPRTVAGSIEALVEANEDSGMAMESLGKAKRLVIGWLFAASGISRGL